MINRADLNLAVHKPFLGLVYVVGRPAEKFFGARYGDRKAGLDSMTQKWTGFAILARAGLAIGYALIVNQTFSEAGRTLTIIVPTSVAIFEQIGPLAARFALVRNGETRPEVPSESPALD